MVAQKRHLHLGQSNPIVWLLAQSWQGAVGNRADVPQSLTEGAPYADAQQL